MIYLVEENFKPILLYGL